jgi:hypothetical protein
MKHLSAIEVFIYALQEQMKKMDNKESDVYLTLVACKELANDIKKSTETKVEEQINNETTNIEKVEEQVVETIVEEPKVIEEQVIETIVEDT